MTANAVLGIDPGAHGALALMTPTTLTIIDMPVVETKAGLRPDGYALGRWIDLHRNQIAFAMIEEVGAISYYNVKLGKRMSQKGTANFSFGFTTGVIHGCLAANQIAIQSVRPEIWKARFKLIGQPKDASRLAASKIAPKWSHLWPLKKHDGRAEAFLLAIYGSLLDVPASYGGSN